MYFSKEERFAVFIDGTNLYHSARNLNFDIDYNKLIEWFRTCDGTFLRVRYYTALSEDNQDFSPLRPLVDWLDYNGYMVVTKSSKEFHDITSNRHRYKGNMDGEIIVDLVTSNHSVDHVILFSGDGDFRAAIEYLQRIGKRVTVISTAKTSPQVVADELRRQADHFVELDDLREIIERGGGPGEAREAFKDDSSAEQRSSANDTREPSQRELGRHSIREDNAATRYHRYGDSEDDRY